MPDGDTIRALMVDPSLFTGPYDAALNGGLVAAGVQPTWAVRPPPQGDRQEIPAEYVDALFHRRVDEARAVPARLRSALKGMAHLWGLAKLVARVARCRPDVVHFQWLVVPPLDVLAMRAMKPLSRIVLTVHDTVPFNGDHLSRWQTSALDEALRLCDALVVHTRDARRRLSARGIPAEKIAVIPHGPLTLHAPLPERIASIPRGVRTFTLFGELKPYKGIDSARGGRRAVAAGGEGADALRRGGPPAHGPRAAPATDCGPRAGQVGRAARAPAVRDGDGGAVRADGLLPVSVSPDRRERRLLPHQGAGQVDDRVPGGGVRRGLSPTAVGARWSRRKRPTSSRPRSPRSSTRCRRRRPTCPRASGQRSDAPRRAFTGPRCAWPTPSPDARACRRALLAEAVAGLEDPPDDGQAERPGSRASSPRLMPTATSAVP